jgi:hypothetical protein
MEGRYRFERKESKKYEKNSDHPIWAAGAGDD